MNRSKRITKKQKEHLINFIEHNKILLGGKVIPTELPKVGLLWGKITNELNAIGPPKTTKQWKDTFSEMKTSVKRRARDVLYGHQGTGGGVPVKPLTDTEERLLALVSKISVEGVNLIEAGLNENASANNNSYIGGPSTSQLKESGPSSSQLEESGPSSSQLEEGDPLTFQTEVGEPLMLQMEEDGEEGNILREILIQDVPNIEYQITENTITNKENINKSPPIKKRKILKEKLGSSGRIHKAISTHDRNLVALTKSNYAIAHSIKCLAKAVTSLANKKL